MNNREWWRQEWRYQRAKIKAEKHNALAHKHNRLTEAWINIMQDAVDKQKRICREEAKAE